MALYLLCGLNGHTQGHHIAGRALGEKKQVNTGASQTLSSTSPMEMPTQCPELS